MGAPTNGHARQRREKDTLHLLGGGKEKQIKSAGHLKSNPTSHQLGLWVDTADSWKQICGSMIERGSFPMDGEDTAEFWKGLKRPLSLSPTQSAAGRRTSAVRGGGGGVCAVRLSSCCLFSRGEKRLTRSANFLSPALLKEESSQRLISVFTFCIGRLITMNWFHMRRRCFVAQTSSLSLCFKMF